MVKYGIKKGVHYAERFNIRFDYKNIIAFAMPMIGGDGQQFYNIADTLIVGVLGAEAWRQRIPAYTMTFLTSTFGAANGGQFFPFITERK